MKQNKEWMPVEWIQQKDYDEMNKSAIRISMSNSPFYKGNRFIVRNGCSCLNKSSEWEYEPMPSNRDDAFYKRCRFDTFEEAVESLKKAEKNE